jgi:hypothetical protein
MKALSILLLAATLSACATAKTKPEPVVKEITNSDHRISVSTLPAGAIIDWNNDVAGVSPCNVVIKDAYKGHWPYDFYDIHTIRARWTDGTIQEQTFAARSTAPSRCVFIHPNTALHYPQQPSLTQRQ